MSKANLPDTEQVNKWNELLLNERSSGDFFASRAEIDAETPMLIEGLMRERGVSVFYGAFDEFKTTLVLDILMVTRGRCTLSARLKLL